MDRSDVTLERMRSFVRVAERGSLSAVAREHGVGQSTVSRHVAELEAALGVTLLNRTTRRITLTDEGRRYHAEARTILRLVDEATDGARSAGGDLTGTIRISCTAALGVRHVSRILFSIQDHHPQIVVDLSLSDARIDLVQEAVDVAIRLGPLVDSTMQCRTIGRSRRILAASHSYLAERGRPETPDDLASHSAIRMSNLVGGAMLSLRGRDGSAILAPFDGRLWVDHGLAAREALAQGRGIVAAHIWLIDDLLAAGTVEQILPDFTPEPVPLSLLVVPGRTRIRRVRMLIDALAASLATLPGLVQD
ncbi:DNA-binding transcriptional regulator, LysR family [Methylobacterium sp. UNC378MF]|uniref:LysR family transcriptional regulator n=1 Tax=Methylobacterium sp. UNC378MF TaxID=1502748 RepID=UPI00087F42A5|nr:LysR family transcriptional regulator [Methylobacterium sp. UNC378MF]SDA33585.1 DNA-binding transcriptional regulator, LysR family [Methylobacterium sp. UNC378MF]